MQSSPVRFRARNPRRGFTLVEILVVIVILVVLAGMSGVAFSKIRERAKSSASASNLRQWGQALVLYTGEHHGAIPFEGSADRVTWASIGSGANETAWFNVLPPYVGQKAMRDLSASERQNRMDGLGIHYCPLVQWRDWRRPAFSYMMNSQIYHPQGPSDDPSIPVRLANLHEISATVMFADLNQDYNDRPRGRGRHVDRRQPGGRVHLVFFDGSLRAFDADYVIPETYRADGVNYSDNNRPDIIWNPWIHPRNLQQ